MSDLSIIFALDPEKCTRENMAELVAAFRARRGQYTLGNSSAGSTKAPSAKEAEALKAAGGLDLKSLLSKSLL